MARKFFYVCAGMLMLALSYHLGASTATAQAPSNAVVAAFESGYGGINPSVAITANGDVYDGGAWGQGGWHHVANIFSGGAVPTQHETWGQVKARYQNTPGMTVTPGANDR